MHLAGIAAGLLDAEQGPDLRNIADAGAGESFALELLERANSLARPDMGIEPRREGTDNLDLGARIGGGERRIGRNIADIGIARDHGPQHVHVAADRADIDVDAGLLVEAARLRIEEVVMVRLDRRGRDHDPDLRRSLSARAPQQRRCRERERADEAGLAQQMAAGHDRAGVRHDRPPRRHPTSV